MPTERKIKLTKLLELLRQESDLEHPLTTRAIIEKMQAGGISVNRRTLPGEIAMLNEQGFEIMQLRLGKENAYYIEDRTFSVPELKILMDAVQAASFVTPKKTTELVSKIAALGGSHQAEILERNMVKFNTRKHSNERIYYNVDTLETALRQQKKVIFLYYDLDESRNKIYRRNGHHYVIEPVALVFLEDNYYVMSYNPRYDTVSNYRVDRMEKVEMIDDSISRAALTKIDVGRYTESSFKMFNGTVTPVTMTFDDAILSAVYDKFGEALFVRRLDEHTCAATVKVSISPTFFGWVFQFADQIHIQSPTTVLEQYRKHCEKVLEGLREKQEKIP